MKKLQIAALTVALALTVLLFGPVCFTTGLKWAKVSMPSWGQQQTQTVPSVPAADPFAGQPIAPTSTAKLTTWRKVYKKGDLAIFFHRGTASLRQDNVRGDLPILYDSKMKRTWTQSGDPIMPKP